MTPSQFAATTILPLLARVVLCLAFFPQGWGNLIDVVEFAGPDAQRLRQMSVKALDAPEAPSDKVSLGAVRGDPPPTVPGGAGAAATPAPGGAGAPATGPSAAAALAAAAASPQAPLKQRKLCGLALAADRAALPFPLQLAWAVSVVEMVGGACVLLGMFSRLWGLLMAVIVVGVFVTTTLSQVKGPWFFAMSGAGYNLVFAQLGLFVLALSVFLVGPGALSLDRAIFRSGRRSGGRKSGSKA